MRVLPPVLTALLLIGAAAPALVAPAFGQTCECPPAEAFPAGPVIQSDEPPPPLPVYDQPPIPEPGAIWTPGYWAWNTYDYYWVPGAWAAPPQPGLLWTPGYWAFVGGAYFFHQGSWGPHVGFYGGVNYGYGYNGLGYEGGRWEGGRFVYNAAVNNFGAVRIANVYTQAVTVAPGAQRISYNGGPGGIALKPTPEQERLTTEERVRPTPLQVSQARAASMEAMQFRSANQGKPAVAATQRPGDLKAPGVVPAKVEIAPGPGSRPPAGAPPIGERRVPTAATLNPAAPAASQTPVAGGKAVAPQPPPSGGPPKPEVPAKPIRPAAAPSGASRAPSPPRPGPAAMAPAERPRPQPLPVAGPKSPSGAAERRPPRPGATERECGKPGAPPCR